MFANTAIARSKPQLREILTVATVILGVWGAGSPSQAQSNPSVDQMINSLRPNPGMLGTTRGIRPVTAPNTAPAPNAVAPTTPAANPPAASASHTVASASTPMHSAASSSPHPAADTERSAPSVNLTVMFANGSAKLTPAATRTLDDLGHALGNSSLVGYKFRIEGHTDTLGNADLNKALSESRAEAVVDYLVSKFNIDRSRLTPVGMGEEGLLVQTPPETSEPRNRRVQVVNLGS